VALGVTLHFYVALGVTFSCCSDTGARAFRIQTHAYVASRTP
jgi:hypothetical protein